MTSHQKTYTLAGEDRRIAEEIFSELLQLDTSLNKIQAQIRYKTEQDRPVRVEFNRLHFVTDSRIYVVAVTQRGVYYWNQGQRLPLVVSQQQTDDLKELFDNLRRLAVQ